MLKIEKLPDNPELYSLSLQLKFTSPLVKVSELVSRVISARRDPSMISDDERALVNPDRLLPFRKRVEVVDQIADESHQIVVGTDGKNPPMITEGEPRPALPGTHERVAKAIGEQRIIDKEYLDELRKFEEKAKKAEMEVEEPRGRKRFSRGLILAGSAVLAASLVALALVAGGEVIKRFVPTTAVSVVVSPKPSKTEDVVKPAVAIYPPDSKPQENFLAIQPSTQPSESIPPLTEKEEISPAPEPETESDVKPKAEPEVVIDSRQVVVNQVLDEIKPGFAVSTQIGEIVGLNNDKKVWEDKPEFYADLLKAIWGKYKENFTESSEYLSKYGATEMQRRNAAKALIAINKLESSQLDEMPPWIATPTLHDAMRFWKLPQPEIDQVEYPLAA